MRMNRKHDELLAETPEAQQFNLSELIAQRAYELYEERGRGDGEDLNDWLRAEAEVQALLGQTEQTAAAVNRAQRPMAASRASA